MGKSIAALALVLSSSVSASAAEAGRVEVALSPEYMQHGSLNGLQAAIHDGGTDVAFGLMGSLGYCWTQMVEPRLTLSLLVDAPPQGGTRSAFGFVPSLKLNFWASARVNPFVEPFVGFLSDDAATSLDAGVWGGVELMATASWGVRLWTGVEVLAGGGTHTIGIPARWGLVAYF